MASLHNKGCPLHPIVNTIRSPTYNISKYLASLLKPQQGPTEVYVKNSAILVQTLDTVTLIPNDLLVSFDVISLFTRVPLKSTIELLTSLFPEATVKLFEYVLHSTYFT